MLRIAAVGAIPGCLGAVGIRFTPKDPCPGHSTPAGTLKGVRIALPASAVATRGSSPGRCLPGKRAWACWTRWQSSWPMALVRVGMRQLSCRKKWSRE